MDNAFGALLVCCGHCRSSRDAWALWCLVSTWITGPSQKIPCSAYSQHRRCISEETQGYPVSQTPSLKDEEGVGCLSQVLVFMPLKL